MLGLLCIVLAGLHSPTCASRIRANSMVKRADLHEPEKPAWQALFYEYMAELQKTDNEMGFNKKCEPYIAGPDDPTSSKGLVVLQHGYTACAGFWYLLKPRLVEQGWTVMVPNMVGHGRNPKVTPSGNDTYEVVDYTADLPTSGSGYVEYSEKISAIVEEYKNENPDSPIVLVGISLGGAVATYMSMKDFGLYNRVMLMNPFIQPPTSLGADYGLSFVRKIVPQLLPAFGIVRGNMMGWGEECDKKRWPTSTGGHGGICQFSLANFKAVFEFANKVETIARQHAANAGVFTGGLSDRFAGVAQFAFGRASKWLGQKFNGNTNDEPQSYDLKVQLLTSIKDGAIANSQVHNLANALAHSQMKDRSSFCAMPEELAHVYISPIDTPTRDHWWLNADEVVGGETALDMLNGFIDSGRFVPSEGVVTSDQDKFIAGDPLCKIQKKA